MQPLNQDRRNHLTRLSTSVSVMSASFLVIIKLVAWIMTGSVAVLASLIDTIMDLFSSMISFIAIRYSQIPADNDHRFGHGKAEPLAALAQSGFTFASGIYLLFEVGKRLQNPILLEKTYIGIYVMIISILATLCLVAFQSWVSKKTQSVLIKADTLHYKGDLLANFGVIIALVVSEVYKAYWLDPLIALLIALYILKAAYLIFKEAFDMLMDKELSDEERTTIKKIVLNHIEVYGFHNLRTRQSGANSFL
ncbi:cation diffusion facilitator family transporter [Curvivirga aplysinae]|uniref:cation diffusion facilitator family transporter n=1 Tax=Curvivirga aplysinae TaxID=2529852 RepID=UPI0012BC5C83|nr:cation diffusion facilitator family transporter [Curvivirga aplysinae]MTI10144.1 cation diffusion facilitator family transporter [Curvivirga aplysinae]